MLEKYITPLLMSYVDKYIKNLSPNDLGVSLWGGDVLLKNLELKLDVLEQEFLFPVKFLSGRIHELKIHIPWTSLGSDSVIITLNTLECSLTYKLKEEKKQAEVPVAVSDDDDKESDSGISDASSQQVAAPSYVQILTQRILNNVEIHINNLIFKYIEDDIVLSVNIKSACMYTVDGSWSQAFSDISAPDFSLRRVIELVDLTVCLDHTSASGRIEVYEEPLLYRAHINCRSLFTFSNAYSFSPTAIYVHVLCEDISLNISDQQFPALIVLLRRLYYLTGSSDTTKQVVVATPPPVMSPEEEGWIGWGWSMLGMSSYEESRASPPPPAEMLFNFSLFIKTFNISCTQVLQHKRKRSAKFQFSPFLNAQIKGLKLDCIAKGYYYSHITLGICSITANLSHHTERVLTCGSEGSDLVLAENSLFDTAPLLEYEDKRHATEDETLSFTKFRAIWISVLSVIPELKQRTVEEFDVAERGKTETFETRMMMNKFTTFLNTSILTSLHLFFSSKTLSALFDPLPAMPTPKKAVSQSRLNVMAHTSVTCLGALVFVSGSNVRLEDGTHPVCIFLSCSRIDFDQHSPLWISQLTKLGPQNPLTNKLCYGNHSIRMLDNSLGFCSANNLQTMDSIVLVPPTFLQMIIRVYSYPQSWVSTMQGLLEVRVEVPHITCMLTMPQIHLLSHFINYWTAKLTGTTGGAVSHGAALTKLTEHALKIEEQYSVELCLSNIGVKFCKTMVVNSVMFSLRGAELFLYKSTDEAVCVLSGPYFTKDLFQSFEQPEDIHVIPALVYLTVQWPHQYFNSSSSPSDRPVLILHSSGLIICWDSSLPAFLAYQAPVNADPYTRSCSPSDSVSLSSSTAASTPPVFYTPSGTPAGMSDSTPSESPVKLQASPAAPRKQSPGGATRDASPAPGKEMSPETSESLASSPENAVYSYWDVMAFLAIQVHITPIVIMLTEGGCGSPQGDIIEFMQSMQLEGLVVCLPEIHVANDATTVGPITPQELPLSVTSTASLVGDPSKFVTLPWKMVLKNLAVTVMTPAAPVTQIVSPVTLEVAVALGTRGSNDICLHADTRPINMALTMEQIRLILRVFSTLNFDSSPANTEALATVTPCYNMGSDDVSSIHTYLPDVAFHPTHDSLHPPLLYIWLQYAIPKVTLVLEDILKLEAEDITASADVEGFLLTKKLKICNMSLNVVRGEKEVSLVRSACNDPVLSVTHCNNYKRNARPSYSVKSKALQVVIDLDVLTDLKELMEQSTTLQPTQRTGASTKGNILSGTSLNTLFYPDLNVEVLDLEIVCPVAVGHEFDNEFVCHVSLISAHSQPDNLLSRLVVDKGYHTYIKSTEDYGRCNYQLQLDVTGVEVYTDTHRPAQPPQNITNAAEAWSQRKLSSKDEVFATVFQGLEVRLTYAPPVIATRSGSQFDIYGSSLEVHLDPLSVLLSLDQIEMMSGILDQMSRSVPPAPGDVTCLSDVTSPPGKPGCNEVLVAFNQIKLLLYSRERCEDDMLLYALAELGIEQGVLSSCTLPDSQVLRASVYTATINIGDKKTGVSYDGDLQCTGRVMYTVSPDSHTPLLMLCRETNARSDELKMEVKHPVYLQLDSNYLDSFMSTASKIKLPQAVPATQHRKSRNQPRTSITSAALHVQPLQVQIDDVMVGVRAVSANLTNCAESTACKVEIEGLKGDVGSHPLFLPFDVSLAGTLQQPSGDVDCSLVVPCFYSCLGMEHVKSLSRLGDVIRKQLPETPEKTPPEKRERFTLHHHDDIRSAGYSFVILQERDRRTPPETVAFSANEASITWRYPQKRSIVSLVTLPVLLACQQSLPIQCRLLYYNEYTGLHVPYLDFMVSQVDMVSCKLPTNGVAAYQWKIELELEVEEVWEERSTERDNNDITTTTRDVTLTTSDVTMTTRDLDKEPSTIELGDVELSAYPALSLAGCLCVDSVSDKIPNYTVSLHLEALEFVLLHHLQQDKGLCVKGAPVIMADKQLELLKLTSNNLNARLDLDKDINIQTSGTWELYYLDYSTLFYTLVGRTQLHASYTSRDQIQCDDVTDNITMAADTPTKDTAHVLCNSATVCLTPGVLRCVEDVLTSWVYEGNISPYQTYVINTTTYSAQLMINGSRYISSPPHSAVACYWNPAHPVFLALQSVHPAWSKPLELKQDAIVEDEGMFVFVEMEKDTTLIMISGGLCLQNNTVLDLYCSVLPLDPAPNVPNSTTLRVHEIKKNSTSDSFVLGRGEHATCFAIMSDTTVWSQPVRLHKDLPESFVVALAQDCYVSVAVSYNTGLFYVTLDPLFVVQNNFAEELIISLSSPEQAINKTIRLSGCGGSEQVFCLNNTSFHNIGCKLDATLPLSMPVSSVNYNTHLPQATSREPWPANLHETPNGEEVRRVLVPHNEFNERSLEAEIHMTRALLSKHTMSIEWWPSCLVHNNTLLAVSVRGAHGAPQSPIPAQSYRSVFNLKGHLFLGVTDPTVDDVIWTTMIDVTQTQAELFKEVQIPGNSVNCHVIVHVEYAGSVTVITIKPSLVLRTKYPLYLKICDVIKEPAPDCQSEAVYWWGDSITLQVAYRQKTSWSNPIDLRSLAPRKGINVMSDKPCSPLPVVLCSVDHAATTYVEVDYNPAPQVYLTNYSEFNFLVGESLPPEFLISSVLLDGDKAILLRPFRSCYFDPFSTTQKLFLQDISENDFIPKLSFAFYKTCDSSTPIRSHKVDLCFDASRSRDVIRLDDDNTVMLSVRAEHGLLVVNIMSEFMVASTEQPKYVGHVPPVLEQVSYQLQLTQLNVLVFQDSDLLAVHLRLKHVTCHATPLQTRDTSRVSARDAVTSRELVTFLIDDIQLDNCLRDQAYDFGVVLFTDKSISQQSRDLMTSRDPFLRVEVAFNTSPNKFNTTRRTIQEFRFQMGKIHVHLEDVFVFRVLELMSCFTSRVGAHAPREASSRDVTSSSDVTSSGDLPVTVTRLMAELYEPLSAQLFYISEIEIELGVHASVKLFLAADKIPLKFREFRVKQLFTLVEHFSQVILAKYISDTILQAGWALASLDLLGSPGLMLRNTISGVKDLVVMPYDGLTRGPTAFVSGIAAGSASLARNIGTGVVTSVTNLALSISRNMDRMSLDEGHTRICAIHRRSYKASHVGTGFSKGLAGLGLHLLSAVAGIVQHPMQDIGDSDGIVGMTKGLVTGVSKGLVGMVTKPLGGAAELVANTGEGLLQGAGWTLSPEALHRHITKVVHTDSTIRLSTEVLQMATADNVRFVRCATTPISILLVIAPDKVYLLLDSIIQCFKRDSVTFLFETASVKIYSIPHKCVDSTLDKALVEKINKMYNFLEESAESSSNLIATLPLDYPRSSFLRNVVT